MDYPHTAEHEARLISFGPQVGTFVCALVAEGVARLLHAACFSFDVGARKSPSDQRLCWSEGLFFWWAILGSNQRPLRCERFAGQEAPESVV